ncbi:MAG: hypothetical protein JOZ09_18760 [Pseudonocardiales bacterium]|nr:hypothetical protein [Pseudonocardiales bacterium]
MTEEVAVNVGDVLPMLRSDLANPGVVDGGDTPSARTRHAGKATRPDPGRRQRLAADTLLAGPHGRGPGQCADDELERRCIFLIETV